MYCKHCGSQIDSDSSFCITCGNQVSNTVVPTVVPQVQNTVVPTVVPQVQNTVVPQVEQEKNNNVTILSIILVMVIFVSAGLGGILFLKQTKSSSKISTEAQRVAYNETTAVVPNNVGWTTTTAPRVDRIEEANTFSVNGMAIKIPAGYTASLSSDVLTVYNESHTKYYMVTVTSESLKNVDMNIYKNILAGKGYDVLNLEEVSIPNYFAYKFDLITSFGNVNAYLVDSNNDKTVTVMFINETDIEYEKNIILSSIN